MGLNTNGSPLANDGVGISWLGEASASQPVGGGAGKYDVTRPMAWGVDEADTPHAIGGGANRVSAEVTRVDAKAPGVRLMLIWSLARVSASSASPGASVRRGVLPMI
jgi:hypothetical protein